MPTKCKRSVLRLKVCSHHRSRVDFEERLLPATRNTIEQFSVHFLFEANNPRHDSQRQKIQSSLLKVCVSLFAGIANHLWRYAEEPAHLLNIESTIGEEFRILGRDTNRLEIDSGVADHDPAGLARP